jgi:hypothetical protein
MLGKGNGGNVKTCTTSTSGALTLRDLVFIGVLAALLFGLTRALFPLAILIGGPVLGGSIVHHTLYAIPVGALVAIGYLRVPKLGLIFLLGLIFALLQVVGVGQWFVFAGFWSGAIVAEILQIFFRATGQDRGPVALALVGGFFLFGLSFLLPLLFALFAGPHQITSTLLSIQVIYGGVPGIVGLVGGWIGWRLGGELRRAGLVS